MQKERVLSKEIEKFDGKNVLVSGRVFSIRKLGGISFILVEDRSGVIQTVWEKEINTKVGDIVEIEGIAKKDDRATGGSEIQGQKLTIISSSEIDLPYDPSVKELNLHLTTLLDNRVLTVRHSRVKAIFSLYDILLKAYEQVMREEGFTEIKTPKLLGALTEGGANFFKVKYFDREAFLAQSPQFYKQIMVGAFERVFEIGPVFRAEPHFTTRHINEYISLDAEMGFIESDEDIRKEINVVLQKMFQIINSEGKHYLEFLGTTINEVPLEIPSIKLAEAKKIIKEKYNHEVSQDTDIDPEGEKLICKYAKEKWNSDFIFVTHYPWKDRPFYTMPADDKQNETLGFDLLYKKMEIITGGQRIHSYTQLVENMKLKKIDSKGMEFYLETFKSAMPPHGGWAIGSERLIQLILNLSTVKEASLFPRDVKRLNP
ncbi:MAG: aspartate--tRNA(Asn) ligase [Patescibacteria group bacterium]|nr:aspartate--tRNA(Asn) ligase [Patescibacteria group bacterium]